MKTVFRMDKENIKKTKDIKGHKIQDWPISRQHKEGPMDAVNTRNAVEGLK